jgi:hypothetical protein
MMDARLLDTVSIITALVLLPMVGVSAYAYISGALTFAEYAAMWREPLALLLGFWLRGVRTDA